MISSGHIFFRKGYRYQLAEDYALPIYIYPGKPITTEYTQLTISGLLTVKKGYVWNGPSWFIMNTRNLVRGSLLHAALYEMMREGSLDRHIWQEEADRLLQEICKEDGMSALRAWWIYQRVRLGGGLIANPKNENIAIRAPH